MRLGVRKTRGQRLIVGVQYGEPMRIHVGTSPESYSKRGIKIVNPEPCFKNYEGGRSYLWLGLSLANLHLPGF